MQLEIWDDERNFLHLAVKFDNIPTGAQFRECYETDTEFIICGEPRGSHDCDKMGCTTVNHVLARFPKA